MPNQATACFVTWPYVCTDLLLPTVGDHMPCMLIYLVHAYAVSLNVLLSWVDAQSSHHMLYDLIPWMLWPFYCPTAMGGYLTMSLCALWPDPMCALIFCCLLLGIRCLVCSLTWFMCVLIGLTVLRSWVDTQSDHHMLCDLIPWMLWSVVAYCRGSHTSLI